VRNGREWNGAACSSLKPAVDDDIEDDDSALIVELDFGTAKLGT
jgi:hypothetical protein